MSFDEIAKKNPTAAYLFRLLAFFNPDGILIRFLKSGMHRLDGNLVQLLSDEFTLQEALLNFETFSLIKWDRQNGSIMVHRLVQAVVKDEMSDLNLTSFRTMTVDICDQAFPQKWNNETWDLCREYVGQVMGPLVDPEASETEKSTNVMNRVGMFLLDDGKAIDSERILAGSLEKRRRILGADHPDTLTSMGNLASTYRDQGRTTEAAALEEERQKLFDRARR
jgi:hypothetical protein